MDDLKSLFIKPGTSIREALKQLDQTALKSLLVVSDEDKLEGVLTDGDVRRCLLSGLDLEREIEGVYNPDPISIPQKDYSVEKAKEIFLEEGIVIIPLTSEDGRIEDVISLPDLLADKTPRLKRSEKINLPTVIMAGGKGTRLKPFTNILPKPLIPIGETTILEKIINHFKELGSASQSIILNYKHNLIQSYLESLEDYAGELHYLKEEQFLGTAGGLALAKDNLKEENFILTNCDIIVNTDYHDALERHSQEDAMITILSAIKHYKIPYGVVNYSSGGIVKDITEKPEYTYTINTGVYILNRKCFEFMPKDTRFDMPDLIEKILEKGGKVLTYPVNEMDYLDVGEWEEYNKNHPILKNI